MGGREEGGETCSLREGGGMGGERGDLFSERGRRDGG